jgi:hypothetical protein
MAQPHVDVVSTSLHGSAEGVRFDVETVGVDKLDRVASQLREICRTATLDLSYRVGELIIREVYDNQIKLWGQQGTRRPSYRLLAARGDLPLSPSALCKSVAVYVLSERVGGRASWKHLGASHVQEVLALDAAQQERLLQEADAQRWTVTRIRAEVSSLKPIRRSRRRVTELVRAVGALQACLSKHRDTLTHVGSLDDVDRGLTGRLCDAVTVLKLQIEQLEQALNQYKRNQLALGAKHASLVCLPDNSGSP